MALVSETGGVSPTFIRSAGWSYGVGIFMVTLALVGQTVAITRPLDVLVDRVFERDDAFYYFVIARNLAKLGWATFDWLHDSSGVQLLWTGFLVPLAWAFPDPITYLRAVLGLCLVLNVLSAILLYRFCRQIHSRDLGDIALALFAGVLVERWNTLEGMEYSLHVIILISIGIVGWKLIADREDRQAALLGLLLAPNYWTRLDSAVVSVAVWGAAGLSLYRHSPYWRSRIALMTLAPMLAAVAYVVTSLAMAGTLLPLSGEVKSHYAQHYFDGFPNSVAIAVLIGGWIKVQLLGALSVIPANILEIHLGDGFHPRSKPEQIVAGFIAAAILAGGVVAFIRRRNRSAARPDLLTLAIFVFVVMLAQSAVCVAVMKEFALISRHHYALHMLFWIVWTALCLQLAIGALPVRLARPAALALVLLGIAAYGSLTLSYFRAPVSEDNYAVARLRLSATLNQTLPPGAIVGAWNAGVLGYFLDRPVVNLDGLVNDGAFLKVLSEGAPLAGYLRRAGVQYLIDHNRQDLTLRYKEKRGSDDIYRNGIRWSDVETIDKLGDVYVLKLRN